MDLIGYALDLRQGEIRLTLRDYREALTASRALELSQDPG
jgi:hypothetical protein